MKKDMSYKLWGKWMKWILLFSLCIGLIGCTGNTPESDGGDMELRISSKPRLATLPLGSEDVTQLVEGNTRFAFDLLGNTYEPESNLVFSPHSLSLTLAMPYIGARGDTQRQMTEALHFTLPQAELHSAMNSLDIALSSYEFAELNISNAVWGSLDGNYIQTFLDTLAEYYGAGIRLADFTESDNARQQINLWVSDETEARIPELLPPGSIKTITDLVLTNAIYFKAAWAEPFTEASTLDKPFYRLDGGEVQVPMMNKVLQADYFEGSGVSALEMPYKGEELAMVILLPEPTSFDVYIKSLDIDVMDTIMDGLVPTSVNLTLPKFQLDLKVKVKDSLLSMGMVDPFGNADFSGIDGTHELFIDDIYHQAFIEVDEAGTEAAAGSAVVMTRKGMPVAEIDLVVDHPFIFFVKDNQTGAVLFLGYIIDPTV